MTGALLLLAASAAFARAGDAPARKGAAIYARTCAVCHGASGEGYKADEAPALAQPDFLASVTDPYLRRAVAEGRAATTMSPWSVRRGGPLSDADIDAVVAYLRTWDKAPRAVLDERPVQGNPERGAKAYAAGCARCHGARGTQGPYERIGGAQLLGSAGDGFLRYAIRLGRKGTAMPAFGEDGLEDALALLRRWQAQPAPRPPAGAESPIPLGPLPLNSQGPQPEGFTRAPGFTPADLVKAQLERGARLGLLDARAPADYVEGHIAGAVSVPFYEAGKYADRLPKDAWLVCYCACPHAESGQLAQELLQRGFTRVAVLDEGYRIWKSRGYPVRTGRAP